MQMELLLASTFLSVVSITTITLMASGAVILNSRRKAAAKASIVDQLLIVWSVAAVAAATILALSPGITRVGTSGLMQLNPISDVDVPDAIGNVLLYLPVGFSIAILWRSKSRPIARATGLAFSLSLALELAQSGLPISRVSSVHDVLFNTIGGFIGAVAGTLIVRVLHRFG
jgi:glycopeptide antibiotics resistance protein